MASQSTVLVGTIETSLDRGMRDSQGSANFTWEGEFTMKQFKKIVALTIFTAFVVSWFAMAVNADTCIEVIHKTEPGAANNLHVNYSGVEGSIRDVILLSNPPGCPAPTIEVVGGNWIHFTWDAPEGCVDSCEIVEYQYTCDYPCAPPAIVNWTYEGLPTLSQWVLIILALSVAALFVWQLMRRRKAAARV